MNNLKTRLTRNLSLFIGHCSLLIGLIACQPATTNRLNTNAPKPAYTMTEMDVRNEKYRSTVNVPVSIALRDVERQLNTQVTGLIYEDNSLDDNGGDNVMTKVWKREAITVSAKDSVFQFLVPLKIWVRAGVSVLGFRQTADTEFEINLRFSSRFSIDPDWSVNTQTRADGYDWVKKPAFSIAGIQIPIAGFVGKMIDRNLGSITTTLDQQVRREINLRTPVLQAWNTLRQPYLLSDEYKTWLLVSPQRVVITPLRFEGSTIRATIGIEGYTLTTIGPKPTIKPAVTLPNLTVVPNLTNTDFQIGLLSEVSYPEAAQLAAKTFVGKAFSFSNNKYSVTVTSIDMFGQDNNLIIKAGLSGSINGDVYLRGKPYYDQTQKTISLTDLEYDFDTKNVLQRTANWLLHGTFANILQKQLTIPVGPQLDEMQQSVQNQLKNNQIAPGVMLNGVLDEVRPDQVYLTPTAMLAVVYAKGRVVIRVDGLQ
jgi:Domain of unknown function (DUF4403)